MPRPLRVLLIAWIGALLGGTGSASAATLPSGFQESTVFSGLTDPMQVDFAPDGRVFVAEKSGLIKVFDGLTDTTPTTFADLRTNVHNFWDRGLLSLELSPNFPGDPSVYVLYTHDAAIGGTAPRWGSPGATSDGCPSPPGPTTDGCVVSGRLSRLQASGNVTTGSEQVLIEDWCQQYPSHSVGDLEFGADGALYVSGGEGASFGFTDWGQAGSPVNPCGDPPGGVGGAMTPPSAEGGSLRSQDVRTGGGTGTSPSTYFLKPNVDITSQWEVEGSAWSALADDIRQPENVPFETDKAIWGYAQGMTTEVGFADQNLAGATPSSGKIWYYADAGLGVTVRVDAIWGGSVRATTLLDGSTSAKEYDWRALDVNPPDQAAVNDLRVRFTVTKASQTESSVARVAYLELNTLGGGAADPTGLDGSLLRVDPATGAGEAGNPLASSSDPNARRMVGFGLRNPFRFTIRPGTNEVWLGDVGQGSWEEINRITNPADNGLDNFGWPCYEGSGRQSGFDSADLSLCESLYATPNVSAPYFAYDHAGKVVANETCPTGSSSVAGADFYTTGPYPDAYDGALFFADYSRDCIWAMQPSSAGGLPSPSRIVTFAAAADNPVDVTVGPGGQLYYPDFDGGTIRRISYTAANQAPTAVATANPTTGAAPLQVQFSASGSSDPEGGALAYAWDLDNDGAFDDSNTANPTWTYAAGTHVATLRVTDPAGASDTDSVTINSGNTAPQVTINSPGAGTLWQVGQGIGFSGAATDQQDGTVAASRLSWRLDVEHCPSNCHTHTIQSWPGVASGSFVAPDHEYPSYLNLHLTATDSGGLSTTTTRRLDPRTVAITMATSPNGLQLAFNGTTARATYTRTVILGSRNTISAPTPQRKSGKSYAFVSWSDGGTRTHDISAGGNATYTASFRRVSGASSAALCEKKAKRKKKKKKRRC